MNKIDKLEAENERLHEALAPFGKLGGALVKHGLMDDSPWTEVADNIIILTVSYGQLNWNITAKQFRSAYIASIWRPMSDES